MCHKLDLSLEMAPVGYLGYLKGETICKMPEHHLILLQKIISVAFLKVMLTAKAVELVFFVPSHSDCSCGS